MVMNIQLSFIFQICFLLLTVNLNTTKRLQLLQKVVGVLVLIISKTKISSYVVEIPSLNMPLMLWIFITSQQTNGLQVQNLTNLDLTTVDA